MNREYTYGRRSDGDLKAVKNPLSVTIVTPSFNQARFIEETILSVQRQDYAGIQHIVVDGGSTDGTLDILKKYPHVAWISETDKGQSDALNKGFRMAEGDIVGWLNADDTYLPWAVRSAVDVFRKFPDVAMVYGLVNIIDAESEVYRTRYSPDFDLGLLVRGGRCYIQPVTFFRREIFAEIGYLDPTFHEAMDYEFFVRVGQRFSVKRIRKVIGNYRTHTHSKTFSGATSQRALLEREEIRRRFGSLGASQCPGFLMMLRDFAIVQYYRYYGGVRSLPRIVSYRWKHR